MDIYLKETVMLDFSNPDIQKLIERKRWKEQNEFDRIKAIYNFVRDDVLFGYNADDNISAGYQFISMGRRRSTVLSEIGRAHV